MASANTEYKCQIPKDAKFMRVRARNAVDLRYAFETGKVAAPIEPFGTIKSGSVYETSIRPGTVRIGAAQPVPATDPTQVIYFGCATAAQFVEIEFWY